MISRVIDAIKRNDSFLITSHKNLEGDALGSLLIMRDILRYFKKKVVIVIQDEIPHEYRFLPDIDNIKKIKDVVFSDYDVLIMVDVSDKKRCRRIFDSVPKGRPTINIDHHISNTYFAHINWIEPEASSTVEMLYKLYRRLKIPLNKKRALWLYVGLLTDTGSFRYPNTTSFTFRLAARLVDYGLDINRIYQNIYYKLSLKEIRLLNRIISTIKTDKTGKIIWFEFRKDFLKNSDLSADLTDYILDLGRMVKDAEVVVMFKEDSENDHKINVNLRSKNKIDVDRIARFFGGGGHRTASGCSIKGTLDKAEYILIKKIKEFIR